MNIKLNDIEKQLNDKNYYKNNDSYDYLLRLPIYQLTLEKKEKLEEEVRELKDKIETLKSLSITEIWKTELNELLKEWLKHKEEIETDYLNDLKGDVVNSKSSKKSVPRKK